MIQTPSPVHSLSLETWCHCTAMTDSCISIICHGCQHIALSNSKSAKEKELCHTSRVGDNILLQYTVSQEFGVATEEQERSKNDRLLRKKVHGRLEFGTKSDWSIIPRFPTTLTPQISRNKSKRGSWSSGWVVNPSRTISVIVE